MVISGILEYVSPGEVINNYTIDSGTKVNTEKNKFDFTTKLSLYWELNIQNGINNSSKY